jgi:uncharacterized protein YjbI with pentapeptide repeats
MFDIPTRPTGSGSLDQSRFEAVAEAHERFARGRGGARAEFRFADLAGLDARRRLLNDAIFIGADLRGSLLAGVHFERAALQGANLSGCDLRAANLRRADLRGANLVGASLNGAVLDEADLRAIRIIRAGPNHSGFGPAHEGAADGSAADMSNCAMRGVRLCGANLKGVNFSGAVLEGANFTGANVAGAVFHGAVINGAIGATQTLTAEQLGSCIHDPHAAAVARRPMLAARLEACGQWIESNGAHGAPAVLDHEDLRPLGGLLRERLLTAMSARGVRAVGVDFSASQLQGANFRDADLRGAVFDAADLRGACFENARLGHARFGRAILTPLLLVGGRLMPTNFKGAGLERADFSATVLAGKRP